MRKMLAGFLFLGFFVLYLSQASPSLTAGDSGEFMTSAATLSLAHPPSYPLYSLSAHAFSKMIPWADASYRFNIFSSFLSALALMVLFLVFCEAGFPPFWAALSVLPIGFSPSFWENALVTEVFALNTFFIVLMVWVMVKSAQQENVWDAGWLLLGVGLGNHQILVVMGAAMAWTVLRQTPLSFWLKRSPIWIGLFLVGFSVNLYLPLRSQANPPLNWGQPTTVDRVIRTLLRKDYGSLTLALGEAPVRSRENTQHQLRRFVQQLNHEIPWPIAIVGLLGIILGVLRKKKWCEGLLVAFLLSGPIFYLLANLPFTGQSDGIMGRFFIFPALILVAGFAGYSGLSRKIVSGIALAGGLFLFSIHHASASAHRTGFLVWDYGHALLRTLPVNSILFLEGGDDAFYSLAYLHEAKNLRPDVEIHDRGGLVFKNPYGSDFRKLPKELKAARRIQVESASLGVRPLFYSTMETEVIPKTPLRPSGFLMEPSQQPGPSMDWPLLILRSMTPLDISDYRTRALAAFFPFMRGRYALDQNKLDEGLAHWARAFQMGPDVDWLTANLGYEYSHRAFNLLQSGQPAFAEKYYRAWLSIDPMNYQAHSNLGVVVERQGRLEEAIQLNNESAKLFPREADPVYNNAVLLWKTKDWGKIRGYLTEALQRNPQHAGARQALNQIPPSN